MKVYIVYSCYSESYGDPSIFFEACATEEKAKEVFNAYVTNIKEQAENSYKDRYESNEIAFEEAYPMDESERTFECRQNDGDQAWEAYIVEQELLA